MTWPEALGMPALILAIFLGEAAKIWAAGQAKNLHDDDNQHDNDLTNHPEEKP